MYGRISVSCSSYPFQRKGRFVTGLMRTYLLIRVVQEKATHTFSVHGRAATTDIAAAGKWKPHVNLSLTSTAY